ncbi:MAG: T9SS type A sorting domain-containing protein [Bacteroidota bacterium]
MKNCSKDALQCVSSAPAAAFVLAVASLFLFPPLLYAQDPANIVFGDRHYNGVTHLTIDYNGDWLMGGNSGDGGDLVLVPPLFGTVRAEGWNEFPITEFIDYEGALSKFSPFASTPDYSNSYFIVGQGGCFLDLPNLLVAYGEEEFWTVEIPGPYDQNYALATIRDEGVLWAPESGESLYWQVDADEQIDLSENWPTGEPIQQMEWMRTSLILVRSDNRVHGMAVSPFGVEIWRTTEFEDPILDIAVIDDQRVAVSQTDSLFVLNGGLGVEFSRSLEGIGTRHLAVDDDRIYLIQQLADGPYAFFYTHSAQEVARTALQITGYGINAIAAQNGRLAIAGASYALDLNDWFPQPRNSQALLRTYTEDGPELDQTHDLAVESVSYGTSRFYTNDFNNCTITEVDGINVTVRNNGDIPINKVALKYGKEVCPNKFCSDYYSHTVIHNNINLQPGEAMELPMGSLTGHQLSPETGILNLCITASAPEHPIEINLPNNRACESIVVVDTDELNPNDLQLSVYPNPATEQIRIEWPVESEELTIYNSHGQVVYQKDVMAQRAGDAIDLTRFPASVYFLQVRTAKGIHSASFVHHK